MKRWCTRFVFLAAPQPRLSIDLETAIQVFLITMAFVYLLAFALRLLVWVVVFCAACTLTSQKRNLARLPYSTPKASWPPRLVGKPQPILHGANFAELDQKATLMCVTNPKRKSVPFSCAMWTVR